MRLRLILLFSLIICSCYSQEINLGASIGSNLANEFHVFTLSGLIEYSPKHAIFSIETDPTLLYSNTYSANNKVILSMPLYLKYRIGNKFRVCPNIGGFIRTNGNYGLKTGLSAEYKIRKQLIAFIKADYNKDFFKAEAPSHFGTSQEYVGSDHSFWISTGILIGLLN
jgi:hypothetical protein